ncbi:hypothetical protein M1N13_00865 [Dehalococcoidia bacterium]|nr:hypothetical protein [Dehalococcoidia bacterium]MCL0048325.1 hypothetical protein [Dehalococcoidia bacterium]MCL0048848.1 hypothetical protein [Dehalococcoidia bacterium]
MRSIPIEIPWGMEEEALGGEIGVSARHDAFGLPSVMPKSAWALLAPVQGLLLQLRLPLAS